jgi:hypothetical membrane protein
MLLIGGIFVGTTLQPAAYSPVRDTISELAGGEATDRWVMTSALIGVGLCYVLVGLGLKPARMVGRILIIGGGAATLLIAAFPQPRYGYSFRHELAVIAAAVACCSWPVFAAHRRHSVMLLTRPPSFAAVGVMLGLAAWYAFESHGAVLGIAERCAAIAPALWLLMVVVGSQWALLQSDRMSWTVSSVRSRSLPRHSPG